MKPDHHTHRLGILSDTHLHRVNDWFVKAVNFAFRSCDTVVHAGDLTDPAILEVLRDKTVFAVHGNMCGETARAIHPDFCRFTLHRQNFAVCHGHLGGPDIEDYLLTRFGDADCIVFGHTHRPVVKQLGSVLLVNPGSFKPTGRYGSPASYAVLTVTAGQMAVELFAIPLTL